MKTIAFFLVALFFVTVSNAVGQDVRYNFDKDTDFSKFKTYRWVPIKETPPVDELKEKQIKASIDAELAKKGLTKTDAETADLYIGYQAAVSTEKQFTSYNDAWATGPGWYRGGWYGGGGGMTTGETSTIYKGQLGLDIYDQQKHDLIWRGVVSKTLDQKAKPDKQQKNLDKAVAKLLKDYPPPKK